MIKKENEPETSPDINNDIKPKNEIKGLKLSRIHGYRAYDCRNNLYYIDDASKIIYCAAGAGIVLDLSNGKYGYILDLEYFSNINKMLYKKNITVFSVFLS